ncbi:hypothetical protein KY290_021668 [Solanum tuberosum]|uniref:Transposon MuDR mudrA n=1 Tax=Solanum tuberosum TaxID=4113 RepID=A0ABQ7V281_SOLTU|nr:hypothetical protein KY290_021668 [Solanum tuberosum]
MELGVENVETFGCRVNKKGTFYMLNTDSDVLNFLNGLKGTDFVDVYVVHPISIPLVVEEILVLPSTNADVSSSPQQDNTDVSSSPHKNRADLSSSPQIVRSPLVKEQAPAPRVEEHFDSDSLYDIDENIDDLSDLDEELLQARQSNIQEQVKEKTARVNLDEIPSGPVGIDAGFEDIYKENRGRFECNLGGDDPYFDNSDPSSDISEDEGDPVENDEVVDPVPRMESTKISFDPIAKKKNAAAGTSVATSNVAAGTSVASAGSQSSVNAGPSAGCTPSAGPSACPSAGCTPSAGYTPSAGPSAGCTPSIGPSAGPSACLISATRPTNASSSGVRPATTLASSGRPTSATSSDVRQLSTQQSISSVGVQKRKTSTALRGGATLAYKKPRPKKAKTTGYGLLFGSGDSVTARSGNIDRVLHSAILSSSTPTNIDLGYKPNGLRWKGRATITQR